MNSLTPILENLLENNISIAIVDLTEYRQITASARSVIREELDFIITTGNAWQNIVLTFFGFLMVFDQDDLDALIEYVNEQGLEQS